MMDESKLKCGDHVKCIRADGEIITAIYASHSHDGSHYVITNDGRRYKINQGDILYKLTKVNIPQIQENKTKTKPISNILKLINRKNNYNLTNIKKEEEILLEIATSN